MLFKNTAVLLILLISCSGNHQTTKNKRLDENGARQQEKFSSGLKIENGINRGTGYTDSLGTEYNLRYIPITIANDSSVTIQLEITFLKEYNNPLASREGEFNLISMPVEWAMNGVEISENMIDELPKYINKPIVSKTLEPGEEFLFAISARYPRKTGYVAPLPEILFIQGDSESFQLCDSILLGERIKSQVGLGLKLVFNRGKSNERCAIIPCGQISYP